MITRDNKEGNEVCERTSVKSGDRSEFPDGPWQAELKGQPHVARTLAFKSASTREMPSVAQRFQARQTASPRNTSSLQRATEMAVQLRKDNEQLRKMIADAQKIAEEAAGNRQGTPSSPEFAHLLELAKEFSTDLANCTRQETERLGNATEISLNAEEFRLDDDDDDDEHDLHLQKLKAQVAAAKTDLARVSAAALRAEPDSDSESDDESDSDVESDSECSSRAVAMPPKSVDRSDGFWTASKTGQRHHISWSGHAHVAKGCTAWQATKSTAASLTLLGGDGHQHVAERLHTRMLGEALLWNSGELWTRQR